MKIPYKYKLVCLFIMAWSTSLPGKEFYFYQAAGPTGGEANCLTFIDGELFAGGRSGYWSTEIADIQWQRGRLQTTHVTGIYNYQQELIVGTERDYIFKSTDKGLHWSSGFDDLPYWFKISKMTEGGGNLFAISTMDGIYRTQNSSDEWVSVNQGIHLKWIKDIVATDSVTVCVINDDPSIYFSRDNGDLWNPADIDFRVIDVCTYLDTVYGVTLNDRRVVKSVDGGESWIELEVSPILGGAVLFFDVNELGYFVSIRNKGVFRSKDFGTTWDNISPIQSSVSCHSIAQQDGQVAISSAEGIFLSTDDCNSWLRIDEARIASRVTALISVDSVLLAGTDGGGVYKSLDNGNSWVASNTGLTHFSAFDFFKSGRMILLVCGGYDYIKSGNTTQLYKSYDLGDSWEEVPNAVGSGQIPLSAAQSADYKFVVTILGLYKSGYGTEWSRVNNVPISPRKVVASGSTVIVASGGTTAEFYRSTNNGNSWTRLEGIDIPEVNKMFAFENTFFVSSIVNNTVFRSDDYGATWHRLNYDFANSQIEAIEKVGSTIYMGYNLGPWAGVYLFREIGWWNQGLLISQDDGETWYTELDTTLTMNILDLTWSEDELLIATDGGGVIKYSPKYYPSYRDNIPTQFLLSQNYPNPCNSQTNINYELFESGHVYAQVFDITGRPMQVVLDQFEQKGRYYSHWNTSDLPSGIYFYRFSFKGLSSTIKCTVLK